jgi:predicted Fe-Mo cluster-binding NifX family protein
MNLRIAIPTDENGKLDGHFGHARFFEIIETENNQIVSNKKLTPPPHTPGAIPKWLAENKVTDVITGGIGERAIKVLTHFNVNVHKGAKKLSSAELAQSLLNQTLVLSEENCNHHHDHHHNHHHDHHHNHGHKHEHRYRLDH